MVDFRGHFPPQSRLACVAKASHSLVTGCPRRGRAAMVLVQPPAPSHARKTRLMVARSIRIATWNINSLRLRAPLLKELMDALQPDVICLQETKVPDNLFPTELPRRIGYPFAAFRGMKGYNGVAIFSRRPIEVTAIAPDWCAKGDCRHLAVLVDAPGGPIELHNFYVPAGGDVPDRIQNPKYGHKLDFIAEARLWFTARTALARTVLVGDLNVAPLQHDVWSHRQLLTSSALQVIREESGRHRRSRSGR